jgi:caffeoyl-CoA O-methyltransferase
MGSPPEKGFGQGSAALARWAEETFAPEDEVLAEIRERSAREGLPTIAVGRMDGLLLEIMARAVCAKKVVEVGTLGGYSGVCLARGMGPDGFLHTFELDRGHAEVARDSFRRAGVAGQVRVHVGRALEVLPEVEPDGPFDLVFIDADKQGYPAYLTWAERHLRVGGLVLADNAFAFGHIHETSSVGDDAQAIAPLRAFAERLARGGRFRATMIPTAEGMAMGVKVR